jgi:hypothetical protein
LHGQLMPIVNKNMWAVFTTVLAPISGLWWQAALQCIILYDPSYLICV